MNSVSSQIKLDVPLPKSFTTQTLSAQLIIEYSLN